jgi:hypothetical protein
VSIEGGVEWLGPELHCFAWALVASGSTGAVSKARSASFMLPDKVAQLVGQGMELGDADDRAFGRAKSGQGWARALRVLLRAPGRLACGRASSGTAPLARCRSPCRGLQRLDGGIRCRQRVLAAPSSLPRPLPTACAAPHPPPPTEGPAQWAA